MCQTKCIYFIVFSFMFFIACQEELNPPENKAIFSERNEEIAAGKLLFDKKCNVCHDVFKDGTAPKLGGITERRTKKWLYDFTRDNSALIMSGDIAALNVYKNWKGSAMPLYPELDSLDIENIFIYIEYEYHKK